MYNSINKIKSRKSYLALFYCISTYGVLIPVIVVAATLSYLKWCFDHIIIIIIIFIIIIIVHVVHNKYKICSRTSLKHFRDHGH